MLNSQMLQVWFETIHEVSYPFWSHVLGNLWDSNMTKWYFPRQIPELDEEKRPHAGNPSIFMLKSTICVFHAKMKTQRKPEQDFLSLKPNIVISRVVFFAIDVLFVKALIVEKNRHKPRTHDRMMGLYWLLLDALTTSRLPKKAARVMEVLSGHHTIQIRFLTVWDATGADWSCSWGGARDTSRRSPGLWVLHRCQIG